MLISTKNLAIDIDDSKALVEIGNANLQEIVVFKDSEYLFKLKMYEVWSNSASYPLSDNDRFAVYVSNIYGANASAVITVTNSSSFNRTEDIGYTDKPSTGVITFRLPTTSVELATSIANDVSRVYTMQVWGYNENEQGYLILDSPITVKNVAVDPPVI